MYKAHFWSSNIVKLRKKCVLTPCSSESKTKDEKVFLCHAASSVEVEHNLKY